MSGLYVLIAGLNGAAMVALAAYGAHGANLSNAALFQTGWQLHAVHSAVLLALALHSPAGWLLRAGFFLMAAGICLFCGALYLSGATGQSGGLAAPAGGMALVASWLAIAAAGALRLVNHGKA